MPLFDDPEHSVAIHGPPTVTQDDAGGDVIAWPTVRAAAVPCSINLTGASTQDRFGQPGVVVTHVVAFGEGVSVQRGDRLVCDDTGEVLHVLGIRRGRAYGSVPALLYCDCEQVL